MVNWALLKNWIIAINYILFLVDISWLTVFTDFLLLDYYQIMINSYNNCIKNVSIYVFLYLLLRLRLWVFFRWIFGLGNFGNFMCIKAGRKQRETWRAVKLLATFILVVEMNNSYLVCQNKMRRGMKVSMNFSYFSSFAHYLGLQKRRRP